MMKAFVNHTGIVPLYTFPNEQSAKLCDLTPGAMVRCERRTDWAEVYYRTNAKTWHGYAVAEFFDEWVEPEKTDVIKIHNATPNESDLAQYLIYLGNAQFNLCGEFCVLYCANWREFDIEAWLDEWNIKQPAIWKRIFRMGRSVPTGMADLINMFRSFDGYTETFETVANIFRFRGYPLLSPERLEIALRSYRLIVGCRIETQFGRLTTSGTAHWVVIESIQREGRGGLVKLYNPASNSIETYAWEQIVSSCTRNPFGLAVAR